MNSSKGKKKTSVERKKYIYSNNNLQFLQLCLIFLSFHMCTMSNVRASSCGGDSGSPLFRPDLDNQGRYLKRENSHIISLMMEKFCLNRYTQVAVVSFGPIRPTECGLRPAGFTRLTSSLLEWVMTTTGMRLFPGLNAYYINVKLNVHIEC